MIETPPAPPLIDRQTALLQLAARLDRSPRVALDTEFVRETTYYPQLCLLQTEADQEIACVDPLAELDLEPLWHVLLAPGRVLMMHSARQDLELIYQATGALPQALFDTQIAAGLLGMPAQIGYAGLVEALLGIRLDKSHTRTDWSRRPLSAEQLAYAAADVEHLPLLHAELEARLAAAGRGAWLQEDCAAILEPELYRMAPEAAWLRVKGLARLSGPAHGAGVALAAWRERTSERLDRPRQWVMRDEALLAIACAQPRTTQALLAIREVPPGLARRRGEEILAALEDPEPGPEVEQSLPLDDGQKKHLDLLARRTRERARELDLEPQVLATRAELAALVRGREAGRLDRGWRAEVLGRELRALAQPTADSRRR